MADKHSRKIFVNLAVKDLKRSMEFFKELGFGFNSAASHQIAILCGFVHSSQLFHQEGRVAERVATDPGPVDAALLVDQDRRMQLHSFEIVEGMEAMCVGVMIIR